MSALKRIHIISFLVVLAIVLILVLAILKPFVNILALGLILAILFRPVYRWFLARVKYPSLSSLLTIVVILVIILGPLWLFGQLVFNELIGLYDHYRHGEIVISRSEIISNVPEQLRDVVENFSRDINAMVGRISSSALDSVTSILSNVANFVVSFFILFFIVFFLLKDGDRIKAVLMDLSPMADDQENKLFKRIVSAVNGVVKGSFLVALSQGIVATIGFFIFDIPQPLLWGMFTVFAALVPTVGTSISLVPAVIYLAVTGHMPQAIGLAIWGFAAVGMIDNFLGPKLIGNSVRLHPVLVLLAVLGGVQFFGILGFLIGPILMAIFVALVEMYRTDFQKYTRP